MESHLSSGLFAKDMLVKEVCWSGHIIIILQTYDIKLAEFHVEKINVSIYNYIN